MKRARHEHNASDCKLPGTFYEHVFQERKVIQDGTDGYYFMPSIRDACATGRVDFDEWMKKHPLTVDKIIEPIRRYELDTWVWLHPEVAVEFAKVVSIDLADDIAQWNTLGPAASTLTTHYPFLHDCCGPDSVCWVADAIALMVGGDRDMVSRFGIEGIFQSFDVYTSTHIYEVSRWHNTNFLGCIDKVLPYKFTVHGKGKKLVLVMFGDRSKVGFTDNSRYITQFIASANACDIEVREFKSGSTSTTVTSNTLSESM